MSSQLLTYSLLMGLSIIISMACAAWAWTRFHSQGALAFFLCSLGAAFFAAGTWVELFSQELPGVWTSLTLKYLGTAALGPLWLSMVWSLTGGSLRYFKSALILLFTVPLGAIFLVSTSSFHQLFFAQITLVREGPTLVPLVKEGLLGMVFQVYFGLTALAGAGILVREGIQNQDKTGKFYLWMVGAFALACTGWFFQKLELKPLGMDLSPLVLSLSGGFMAIILYKSRVLDLPPLQSYRLTDSLREGLALFDGHGHLLGFNPAMSRIHPFFLPENLGMSPTQGGIFPELEELLLVEPIKTLDIPGRKEGERKVYQVNRSSLRGRLGEPSGHIILLSDITSRVELMEKLSLLARTDELTGIANRRYFFDRLREESDRCTRYGGGFSLAILDLDHFKSFNDTWGHDVGDAVLRRAVKIWAGCLRTSDLLARYGGEEFGLLIPGAGTAEALQLLERMNRSLQYQDTADGDPRLKITASVGLAQYQPGEDIHDCIRRADEALYDAKHQGRNRICVAGETKV